MYDKYKKKRKKRSEKYGVNNSKNFIEISEYSDAVIIAIPTHTHFFYLSYFLKIQVNIFVEKPIVSNLKEILNLKGNNHESF